MQVPPSAPGKARMPQTLAPLMGKPDQLALSQRGSCISVGPSDLTHLLDSRRRCCHALLGCLRHNNRQCSEQTNSSAAPAARRSPCLSFSISQNVEHGHNIIVLLIIALTTASHPDQQGICPCTYCVAALLRSTKLHMLVVVAYHVPTPSALRSHSIAAHLQTLH